MMFDLIVHGGTVLPMTGREVLPNAAVAIRGQRIVEIGDSSELMRIHSAHRYVDATGMVVMPGLIDAHIHTGIALVRGLSQDTDSWMEAGLWPFVSALTESDRVAGSMVNIIEAVKAGTTTFNDFDSHMSQLVRNHAAVGTRAHVADMINELPDDMSDWEKGTPYPFNSSIGEAKFAANLDLYEQWHGAENDRIRCAFGPQAIDMMTDELMLEVREAARKRDSKIHIHVEQGDRESEQMQLSRQKRSIPHLAELGILDDRIMGVHLTTATPDEVAMFADSGASMVLCSGSIGIIDGVVPPADEFLRNSRRLALGSDQAPGNNCNNMFNELKFTAILNKCRRQDPTAFPAWDVLEMATSRAAEVLGLGDEIGTLEPGKKADLICVDFTKPNLVPRLDGRINNIVANLVYSARGDEVHTSIIDGQVVMEDRVLTNVDEQAAVQHAQDAAEALIARIDGV